LAAGAAQGSDADGKVALDVRVVPVRQVRSADPAGAVAAVR
jgi:hypothetical protein